MASFDYAIKPIRGNGFQTNSPEHGSDDRTGNKVTSVYVINDKDMAFSL